MVLEGATLSTESRRPRSPRTLPDGKLWRLSFGSGVYLYAQIAVLGFGVLFLRDEHGLSAQPAALVFAGSQVLAVDISDRRRPWSDRLGARSFRYDASDRDQRRMTLRRSSRAVRGLLVPVVAFAGGLTMAWNGLSFTAAAELAGALRSGVAIGVQQTVLAAIGVAAPLVFAATVSSGLVVARVRLRRGHPAGGVVAAGPTQ